MVVSVVASAAFVGGVLVALAALLRRQQERRGERAPFGAPITSPSLGNPPQGASVREPRRPSAPQLERSSALWSGFDGDVKQQ